MRCCFYNPYYMCERLRCCFYNPYYMCELLIIIHIDCVCFFPTVHGLDWVFNYWFVCGWYFYWLIYTLIYFKILCVCLRICFYWFRSWRDPNVYVLNICDWMHPFLIIDLFSVNYDYYYSISCCPNRNVHKKLPVFIEIVFIGIVHRFITAMCYLLGPIV